MMQLRVPDIETNNTVIDNVSPLVQQMVSPPEIHTADSLSVHQIAESPLQACQRIMNPESINSPQSYFLNNNVP